MTNKDQEQLLQDASTLLMFASLVAKHELLNQHSPTSNMSSPPTVQQLPQQPQQPLPQQYINSGSSTRKSSEHKETSVVSSPPSVKFVDIINNPSLHQSHMRRINLQLNRKELQSVCLLTILHLTLPLK